MTVEYTSDKLTIMQTECEGGVRRRVFSLTHACLVRLLVGNNFRGKSIKDAKVRTSDFRIQKLFFHNLRISSKQPTMNTMQGLLVLTTLVLSTVDNSVVAENNCYVCTWTDGGGTADACSDANFDSSSPLVQSVPCGDKFCYWYSNEAAGLLPAVAVRSCDLDIGGGSGSYCSKAGKNPGPGGQFEIDCCKGNLCNAPGGGSGGGDSGAVGIVMDVSVVVATTVLTIWTARVL